jgi:hypothetical protein
MTSAVFQCLVLIVVVGVFLAVFWSWANRASPEETQSEFRTRHTSAIAQAAEPGNDQSVLSGIGPDEPLAIDLRWAIQTGDLATLRRLLTSHPGWASARIGPRTLLHIATDWPGHFPNNAASVVALLAAGAEVKARLNGRHTETPLHWAASSDDIEVLDVLLDAGANIEAPGSVIDEGTALADAVAFGQWQAARRLVERGARSTLWQAAALGLMARVQEYFEAETPPLPDDVTNAFWFACHGGQLRSAEYLLERRADLNWIGPEGLTPFDAARRSESTEVIEWLSIRGARSAAELG